MRNSQYLKEKYQKGVVPGTVEYQGAPLFWLMFGSFFGGIVGALGLGGGVVFNPLLLGLGVLPQVTTATGMYMIMFGTFSASLVYFSIGALVVPYAALIGSCAVIGIIVALFFIKRLIEHYKRPSVVVFVLAFILGVSAIMVPVFNTLNMMKQVAAGIDITAFGKMC